jgi:hypothetical protein
MKLKESQKELPQRLLSLLQNPESEFDFFAARGEMEGAGAPFLA